MSKESRRRKFKRTGTKETHPGVRRVGASGALVEWGERRYEPTLTTQSQDIPQKAETRRKWLRYFYEYDPLFGSLVDFFADFPMVGMHNEHPDGEVVKLYDDLCSDIDMDTYLADIFFEYYLIADVFPFIFFESKSGELRETTLLNPDDIVVERTIFSEQEMLYIKPDEGLKNLVNTRKPVELYQRLSPDQIHAVKTGKNILLNSRQAAHLKRGGSRYGLLGIPLGHRIFKSIIQRDKLREAQWVMADRFTVPMRVFQLIGTDEHPAGPTDVVAFSSMLAEANDDPALAVITNFKVDVNLVGTEGKWSHVYNDIEFMMKDYLMGFGVTQALVTGEGVPYANATVGLDRLIRQFKAAHRRTRRFIEQYIYSPFAEEIDVEEPANFKWNQVLGGEQTRQKLMKELYDIEALSLRTLHETYDVDHESEMARIEEEGERLVKPKEEVGKPGVEEDLVPFKIPSQEVGGPEGEGLELIRSKPPAPMKVAGRRR